MDQHTADLFAAAEARFAEMMDRAETWRNHPKAWYLPEHPTWDDVARRDSRLSDLERDAHDAGRRDRETYDTWYREIKPRLSLLVGRGAEMTQPPPLMMSNAYDAAYGHLLRVYEDAS